MALPPSLDFDKVARPALADVFDALGSWLSGHPRDETAFLNHLTGRLNRRRRGCDVGVDSPVGMTTRLYMLHRRGTRQSDQYGADLALTVGVEPGEFLKTALFQFKKSLGFKVEISRQQIADASVDPRIRERSFILGIEEQRAALRINALETVAAEFDHHNAEQGIDCAEWMGVVEWLSEWFKCNIGPPSDTRNGPVEALLERFTIEPPDLFFFGQDTEIGALDILPARAWLQMRFSPQEPRILP